MFVDINTGNYLIWLQLWWWPQRFYSHWISIKGDNMTFLWKFRVWWSSILYTQYCLGSFRPLLLLSHVWKCSSITSPNIGQPWTKPLTTPNLLTWYLNRMEPTWRLIMLHFAFTYMLFINPQITGGGPMVHQEKRKRLFAGLIRQLATYLPE